jgi:hypothetical protein
VCSARLKDGGAADCDLAEIARSHGLAPGRVDFTVKILNSGCWGTHGNAFVNVDGRDPVQVMGQGDVVAHCGWTERQEFSVEFSTGEVFMGNYNPCINDGQCNH